MIFLRHIRLNNQTICKAIWNGHGSGVDRKPFLSYILSEVENQNTSVIKQKHFLSIYYVLNNTCRLFSHTICENFFDYRLLSIKLLALEKEQSLQSITIIACALLYNVRLPKTQFLVLSIYSVYWLVNFVDTCMSWSQITVLRQKNWRGYFLKVLYNNDKHVLSFVWWFL